MIRKLICLIQAVIFCTSFAFSQSGKLPDGRGTEVCRRCIDLLQEMPKEVMFGIHFQENGEIIFTMSNRDWFNKFIAGPQDGITVDIVPKSRYNCNTDLADDAIRGKMLTPVYQAELRKNIQDLGGGQIAIKLGAVPVDMRGKEIEGNFVLINNGKICYNTYFLDIPRALWELLPMGLYADTLMHGLEVLDYDEVPTAYASQLEFTIPFSKNSASYNEKELKPILDSLKKHNLHITKMHIRSYSSVEGSVTANAALQKLRASSVINALQQQQTASITSNITSLENWMEFYRDITSTPFNHLKQVSRQEVKRLLMDASTLGKLEPILQKHRKAVVTIYLNKNSGQENVDASILESNFKKAITEKKLSEAAAIQREVFNRIADNRLPAVYLGRLEIPREKTYSNLLTSQVTYNYLLQVQYADEVIEAFKAIIALDPSNGRARYNLCALDISYASLDTTGFKPDSLRQQVQALSTYKIPSSLVKRMMLNLHIISSEYYLSRFEYDKKDKAAQDAVKLYYDLELKDSELLSMAKYLSQYSLMQMAEEILEPRVTKIDVNEDLVFYYLNLKLFRPGEYGSEEFTNILNNAITLNNIRFCRLFRSKEMGGIGFQLLEHDVLKSVWCEECSKIKDDGRDKLPLLSN